MFNSLRINPSGVLADSECEQELQNHFVSLAGSVRKTSPATGQSYGSVGLSFGQPVALQSCDCPIDGDVSDPELTSKVRNSALAFFTFDLVDRLDIVLGKFRRVGAACPNVLISGFPADWHERAT